MITKTEVLSAISRCEQHAGFSAIDNSLVSPGEITKGDLLVLIEAAKRARFVNACNGCGVNASSSSGMKLPDEY